MMSVIVSLAAAAASAGAQPAPEPARLSLQQRFDQASTHALSGQCVTAVPELEALQTSSSFQAGTLPGAMLAVLKGVCQVRTGAVAEGEQAIHEGLPRLRENSGAFRVEITSALLALGDGAMSRWDYEGARLHYEQASLIPEGADPGILNLKLAQATAFDGGEAPLRYASLAINHARAFPGITPDKIAEFQTVHARILLNQGRDAEAYAELKDVLKLTGGLDLKVSLGEIVMRGDLALAAQVNGDVNDARRYLAYTGAGRTKESAFDLALAMDLPICGTQTGLRPEDFAVVDFSIGDDGRVFRVNPVYTRGSAEVAASFARTISGWAWDPGSIKKIPAFSLLTSRVEIRCTTAGQQVPGLTTPIEKRFRAWATGQLGLPDGEDDAALAKRVHTETSAADPARRLAANGLLAIVEPASSLIRDALLTRALADAKGGATPAEARNFLTIAQIDMRIKNRWDKSVPVVSERDLMDLISSPAIANDALAANTLRLLAAVPTYRRAAPANAAELLGQAAADDRLPASHPLRQAAYLQLANIAAKQGDFAKAQAYFQTTGLTEEQCALLGLQPALRRSGINHNDFPVDALRYGFEGWVTLEYDIQSDGKPAGIRSVIAYPPFIFSQAAASSAQAMRFQSSYRPSGGTSCSAQQSRIIYRLPRS